MFVLRCGMSNEKCVFVFRYLMSTEIVFLSLDAVKGILTCRWIMTNSMRLANSVSVSLDHE